MKKITVTKTVNSIVLFVLTLCLTLVSTSCSDGKQSEIEKLNKQVDSLMQDNAKKDEMISYIGVIADGLDSIAIQEGMLFHSNKGKEGTIIDKAQLRKNLEFFEQKLSEQRNRISQLVDSLKAKGEKVSKLTSLVTYLNKQLDEKDNLVKTLRAELNKKNVNITHLNDMVASMSDKNSKLEEKVEKQVKALAVQSEIINEAYVIIDTKKSLSSKGIVSGGLFKKTKVNYNTIQKTHFRKVDIREFTEVVINSKKPKVLTPMPPSSYRIETNGSTSTLYISDPTAFWSVSNYLVIML